MRGALSRPEPAATPSASPHPHAVLSLASAESKRVTGHARAVDGGLTQY
ncbi:MAG: hypothetical protein AB7V10_07355 [Leucobacter sp.]